MYIFALSVCLNFKPMASYGQTVPEMPQQRDLGTTSLPDSMLPPGNRRIPDQFFRHDDLPGKVIRGEILSLSEIRKVIKSEYPGRIVDVRLLVPKREGINYLYDVRVLTKGGKLLSVKIDAKSAQIVDVKG